VVAGSGALTQLPAARRLNKTVTAASERWSTLLAFTTFALSSIFYDCVEKRCLVAPSCMLDQTHTVKYRDREGG